MFSHLFTMTMHKLITLQLIQVKRDIVKVVTNPNLHLCIIRPTTAFLCDAKVSYKVLLKQIGHSRCQHIYITQMLCSKHLFRNLLRHSFQLECIYRGAVHKVRPRFFGNILRPAPLPPLSAIFQYLKHVVPHFVEPPSPAHADVLYGRPLGIVHLFVRQPYVEIEINFTKSSKASDICKCTAKTLFADFVFSRSINIFLAFVIVGRPDNNSFFFYYNHSIYENSICLGNY